MRLWELERDRFRFADGVLYSQFLCQKDFELLRDYARVSICKMLSCNIRHSVVTDDYMHMCSDYKLNIDATTAILAAIW